MVHCRGYCFDALVIRREDGIDVIDAVVGGIRWTGHEIMMRVVRLAANWAWHPDMCMVHTCFQIYLLCR